MSKTLTNDGSTEVAVTSSALPSGAATATKQDTGNAALATLAGAVAGTEVQVDVLTLPSLPAGTNNIGDVDVLTVPTDPFGANADAASATGSISAKLRFIAATGIPITASALPSGAATETTLAAQKVAHSVSASQLTASGDTDLLGSGTYKILRVEASNSHASTALVVGLKNANLNGGAVFGKKYLPAAGGQAVWVFPRGYLQITASTFVGNLSAAGQVEFTVYYE